MTCSSASRIKNGSIRGEESPHRQTWLSPLMNRRRRRRRRRQQQRQRLWLRLRLRHRILITCPANYYYTGRGTCSRSIVQDVGPFPRDAGARLARPHPPHPARSVYARMCVFCSVQLYVSSGFTVYLVLNVH